MLLIHSWVCVRESFACAIVSCFSVALPCCFYFIFCGSTRINTRECSLPLCEPLRARAQSKAGTGESYFWAGEIVKFFFLSGPNPSDGAWHFYVLASCNSLLTLPLHVVILGATFSRSFWIMRFRFFFVCDCNLAVLDVVFSLWLMIIDGIKNTSRLVVCFYLSVCIIRLRGRSGERFCIVKSLKTHWQFLSVKPSTPGNNFSYLSLSCFRFTPRTADFLIALRDWSTECWSWNCVNRTNRFECQANVAVGKQIWIA